MKKYFLFGSISFASSVVICCKVAYRFWRKKKVVFRLLLQGLRSAMTMT